MDKYELCCNFVTRDQKYNCEVTSALIRRPNIEILAFKGVHENKKSDQDVKGMLFLNGLVEYIPKCIESIFTHLTTFEIDNCGLKEIRRKDLMPFPYLSCLSLSGNKLTSLPDNLFRGMLKLTHIYFNNNLIEAASSKLFDPIKQNDFQEINFTKNAKIDDYFVKNKHNTLENLMKTLDKDCVPPKRYVTKPSEVWMKNQEQLATRGDFTIKFHEKEFKLHKATLSAHSSVFEQIFTGDALLNELQLKKITNFSEDAFRDFICYFYCGTIRSKHNAMELLELATEFNVIDLKALCEEIILKDVNDTNALEIFNLGRKLSEDLKIVAFERIQQMFPDLTDEDINNCDYVNDMVKTKQHLDDLKQKARAKKVDSA